MAANSKIEWCDHTSSPWYGCAHVHAGCDNCYAETLSKRNPGTLGIWGPDGTRIKSKSFIPSLFKWNREAKAAGKIVSVFPSLCDPFEDRPELIPWRREMFEAIDQCPHVRLMLLTKRPGNVPAMWPLERIAGTSGLWGQQHRRNVWLLASVSDQASMDALFPELVRCRQLVPVLGLSAEPLLGPIDLGTWFHSAMSDGGKCAIDWTIIGGESGSGARGCDVASIRSIRDQCRAADVSVFIKQLGANPYDSSQKAPGPKKIWSQEDLDADPEGAAAELHNCLMRMSMPFITEAKGGDWNEWPADLRVREFPAQEVPA